MRRLAIPLVVGLVLLAGGAVRADVEVTAELLGINEIPPVRTQGTGYAYFYIPSDQSYIYYYLAYADLNGPATAAHIHAGSARENGPIIFDLEGIPGGMSGEYDGVLTARNFRPGGTIRTYEQAIEAMQRGQTYVNIHSRAHPDGEIRGQTQAPQVDLELYAFLSGENEIPPVRTAGNGIAYFYIPADRSYIYYYVAYADLNGQATAAHIHAGSARENGPIIFDLAGIPFGTSGEYEGILTPRHLRPGGTIRTFEQAIEAMQRGLAYVNVHSRPHPDGEIRGQTGSLK